MHKLGRSAKPMGELLVRLTAGDPSKYLTIIASHPLSEDRLAAMAKQDRPVNRRGDPVGAGVAGAEGHLQRVARGWLGAAFRPRPQKVIRDSEHTRCARALPSGEGN